jgi:O-antigen ligase
MAHTTDRSTGSAGYADQLAGWIGVTTVACVPFALGGGPTWAWGTAAGCIGGALALHGLAAAMGARTTRSSPAVTNACATLAAVAFLTVLQGIPGLPGAHPVWVEVAPALDAPPPSTWSRRPSDALASVVMIGVVAGTLWLGAQAPPAVRRGAPVAIAIAAALCAVYGLLVLAVGSEQVLWLDKPAYRQALTGTFVSRNAFGAFMGVALLGLVAVAQGMPAEDRRDLGWLAVPALLVVTGLAASESRGAISATILGIAAILAVTAVRDGRMRAWAIAILAAIGIGGLGMFALAERLAGVPDALVQRAEIYRIAVDAIQARPWVGHGAGSFDAVMRAARPPHFDEVVTQAHSLYLGAAVAWGLPAALGLVTAGVGVTIASLRNALHGDPTGTAALGICVLLGAHGLIDFAPRLPGVALPALWLMGAGCRRRAPP